MYIKERRKEKPVEGGALYRQRYWAYDPAVGIASDHGKYDVVPGKRNDKISVKRVPLSRSPKKKRPIPPRSNGLAAPPKFIEVSTKFMRWKQINERIAKERKMGVGGKHGRLRIFEREWVVDERNPNETFLVGIPPATPLDRAIHGASTICARFWRACMARMFATKFRASRIIQRAARIYLAKTLAKRIKKRREDNEKESRKCSGVATRWRSTSGMKPRTNSGKRDVLGQYSMVHFPKIGYARVLTRENRDKEKRAALTSSSIFAIGRSCASGNVCLTIGTTGTRKTQTSEASSENAAFEGGSTTSRLRF